MSRFEFMELFWTMADAGHYSRHVVAGDFFEAHFVEGTGGSSHSFFIDATLSRAVEAGKGECGIDAGRNAFLPREFLAVVRRG